MAPPAVERSPWEDEWVCVAVPFDAHVSGRLVLAAPAPLAAQVAAEILCVDPMSDTAIAHAGVAVAEFAKVLAGVLVSEIFGNAASCRLGLPRITADEPTVAEGERASRITLLNDFDQPIRVEVVLADAA
jgi:hypothetical protein